MILVIDSCDGPRLGLVKQELMKIVADEVRCRCHLAERLIDIWMQSLSTALLLVLANKQDLPVSQGRLTPAQVSEALGLTDLREREWQIMGCSALTGAGLMEGMDWLVTKLASR